MIRSMTGFGVADIQAPGRGALRVEVRTVNHRHLAIRVRLPRGWEALESGILASVRGALRRGSVSVAVRSPVVGDGGEEGGFSFNLERAGRYCEELAAAAKALGIPGRLDLATLASLPGVWARVIDVADPVPDGDLVAACLSRALAGVVKMREAEGRRLEAALETSLARIQSEVRGIESLAPERLVRERDRLRCRVAALGNGVDVDQDRIAREIAFLAERWDILEEIVRLNSHIELFCETLASGAGARDADPGTPAEVGKRLGFVVQEMNREVNTVAAKANDAQISASAVCIKEELERIREQLENVE